MNTRPVIENPSEHAALSVTFNHDASRFVVGLDSGFCIFLSNTCQIQTARVFNAGLGLVQMMGNANYLALVGGGRSPKFPQNKAIIWDDSKGKIGLEIATLTAVRGVQISKTRIAVVLQNSVRLYAFQKPPTPLAIYETTNNYLGLCCLTERHLVIPGRTPGQVHVIQFDTGSVSIIPAHSSSLRALQLSSDGDLLATASEKGTIIRIFSTNRGAKLAERRRGSESATIYSLRFSPSGNMLACTSDKGNLHIFDVPNPRNQQFTPPPSAPSGSGPNTEARNKWGILSNIPFGPFGDIYSFTTAPFETGEEPLLPTPRNHSGGETVLGTSRPVKGVIGWVDENTLIVVGAGQDARWEKFVLREGEDGRFIVVREGWKKYLGN
ncbi:WD40 repeat-like protein [Daldinia vernicosa]|uniref:WD40 repeat-like protein n=1 Tax=Daldinia vernicosa TaxID=114800 RepID=UPI002007749D|nr:WD40 repeat-like protein [Daldinia vernicosa]KAI0848130.1 WD40 repeat-like protein [Daldinia vernicosa]